MTVSTEQLVVLKLESSTFKEETEREEKTRGGNLRPASLLRNIHFSTAYSTYWDSLGTKVLRAYVCTCAVSSACVHTPHRKLMGGTVFLMNERVESKDLLDRVY
jgi:hypothetical protein